MDLGFQLIQSIRLEVVNFSLNIASKIKFSGVKPTGRGSYGTRPLGLSTTKGTVYPIGNNRGARAGVQPY